MEITRRTATTLFFVPWYTWAQDGVSDAEWLRFLAWYKATPPEVFRSTANVVFAAYKAKIIAEGTTATDAEPLVARLQARSRTDREYLRANSNLTYSAGIDGQHGLRTTEPNAFLAETVGSLLPGKALDVGMGEGRNTVYLAQKGWDVTGVDLSEVGVAKAKERARSLGRRINAQAQDINTFELGTLQWDLVCLLYFPIDESMRNLHQRIVTSLKPGGLVIIEGVGSGGTLDALIETWHKWEPMKLRVLRLDFREGEQSDWGAKRIGRLLLQKPGA
jgi:SAM-dependent methyltransferase